MISRPTIAAFGTVDGQLAVGGIPLEQAGRPGGLYPVLRLRPRAAHRSGGAAAGRRCPTRINLSYAVKANPMPAVVQHLAALVDSFDVASAVRCALRWTRPCRAAGQLRRSRQDRRGDHAGGRGGRHHRDGVGHGGGPGGRRPATAWVSAARGDPGQSRLPGQGLGHAHGRRAAAVRRRCRAGSRSAGRP